MALCFLTMTTNGNHRENLACRLCVGKCMREISFHLYVKNIMIRFSCEQTIKFAGENFVPFYKVWRGQKKHGGTSAGRSVLLEPSHPKKRRRTV